MNKFLVVFHMGLIVLSAAPSIAGAFTCKTAIVAETEVFWGDKCKVTVTDVKSNGRAIIRVDNTDADCKKKIAANRSHLLAGESFDPYSQLDVSLDDLIAPGLPQTDTAGLCLVSEVKRSHDGPYTCTYGNCGSLKGRWAADALYAVQRIECDGSVSTLATFQDSSLAFNQLASFKQSSFCAK